MDTWWKKVKIRSFFAFLIPVSVRILIIRSRDIYNSLCPFSCFFFSFFAKGIIYPVCDRMQLILSYNMNLSTLVVVRCQSFSEKPYNAYQMKLFEKDFCFFSAFDSLNLLEQKRYPSSYFRQKKNKDLLIYYFIFFFYYYSVCTSFHM